MDVLDSAEVRVLGALMEKERTTPDYYPLSLNALTHACNQLSNREPVMQLEEAAVSGAVLRLREKSLVRATRASDSRVPKYSHLLGEALELDERQLGLLCVLMLRGPQTAGELKARAGRLVEFTSAAEVESTLAGLAARQPYPLAVALPRRPGQKEVRYAHLLSGEVSYETPDPASPAARGSEERIALLEAASEELRSELADVRRQLEEFRRQFE
jgi:uncharacterized protein